MPAAGGGPVVLVLPTSAGRTVHAGAAAAHRRAVLAIPVLRQPADESALAAGGDRRLSAPCAAANATHGPRRDPLQAAHQRAAARAPIDPYLLGSLDIRHRYQVECADITYIPTAHGFLNLVAVMDWHSRKVLSWRLSNTLDSAFCAEALDEALRSGPRPEIFNTDQASQFTSEAFTGRLEAAGVRVSMDGRGRGMDNIVIERLWRSLKYEPVYLHELRHGLAARRVIGEWIPFYHLVRPHSALDGRTPCEVLQATDTASARGAIDS